MALLSQKRSVPAFTLIDLLIVIVLIGLLVSILLPALAKVRRSANDIASLANLRSHGQVFSVYQTDWRDWFPQYAEPHADYSIVRDETVSVAFEYFVGVVWWPIALSLDYYDGNVVGNRVFLHPESEDSDFNNYILSSALMAEPAYWNRETRESGTGQWGGCRIDQIRFPSAKAQLVEWHPINTLPFATEGYTSDQPGVAFSLADGSAMRSHTRDLVAPYPFGDGTGFGHYQSIGIFGMHTVDGWIGRDVK